VWRLFSLPPRIGIALRPLFVFRCEVRSAMVIFAPLPAFRDEPTVIPKLPPFFDVFFPSGLFFFICASRVLSVGVAASFCLHFFSSRGTTSFLQRPIFCLSFAQHLARLCCVGLLFSPFFVLFCLRGCHHWPFVASFFFFLRQVVLHQ